MMNLAQIGMMGYSKRVSYVAAYQAILDRATALGYTKPSDSQKLLQNQLAQDGQLSLFDCLYVFATDGDSDYATLNWASPSNNQITKVNSPTFTSDVGFNGNGSTSYLNQNWAPNNGVNFSLNSACVFFKLVGAHNAQNIFGVGNSAGMSNGLNGVMDTTTTGGRLNNNTADLLSTSDLRQTFLSFVRSASTGWSVYSNGVSQGTITRTSVGVATINNFLLCRNLNGTANGFLDSVGQLQIFGVGSASLNQSDLYTAFNTYLSAI